MEYAESCRFLPKSEEILMFFEMEECKVDKNGPNFTK